MWLKQLQKFKGKEPKLIIEYLEVYTPKWFGPNFNFNPTKLWKFIDDKLLMTTINNRAQMKTSLDHKYSAVLLKVKNVENNKRKNETKTVEITI